MILAHSIFNCEQKQYTQNFPVCQEPRASGQRNRAVCRERHARPRCKTAPCSVCAASESKPPPVLSKIRTFLPNRSPIPRSAKSHPIQRNQNRSPSAHFPKRKTLLISWDTLNPINQECFFLFNAPLEAARLAAQRKAVGNHGDELAVRGLALDVTDRVAEKALQRFQIAAIPRHLDGVADGALDA